MNIEREIQARIEFKFNELLTAVENTANANWGIAFNNTSQKHANYWEAFNQMKQMLIKEMSMLTPYDDMAKRKEKEIGNDAIEKLSKRFCKLGTFSYKNDERYIVSVVEDIINKLN